MAIPGSTMVGRRSIKWHRTLCERNVPRFFDFLATMTVRPSFGKLAA